MLSRYERPNQPVQTRLVGPWLQAVLVDEEPQDQGSRDRTPSDAPKCSVTHRVVIKNEHSNAERDEHRKREIAKRLRQGTRPRNHRDGRVGRNRGPVLRQPQAQRGHQKCGETDRPVSCDREGAK